VQLGLVNAARRIVGRVVRRAARRVARYENTVAESRENKQWVFWLAAQPRKLHLKLILAKSVEGHEGAASSAKAKVGGWCGGGGVTARSVRLFNYDKSPA
jgi:hypothetical protein